MSEPPLTSVVEFCANCGTRKESKFCPQCGQNDRNYNSSLYGIIRTIASEVLAVDSKVFRSFTALFLQPGRLSVEFAKNRRASYSSPIRIYLATSLLYFFIAAVLTESEPSEFIDSSPERSERRQVFDSVMEHADAVDASQERLLELLPSEFARKLKEVMNRPEVSPSRTGLSQMLLVIDSRDGLSAFESAILTAGIQFAHSPDITLNMMLDNLPFSMLVLLPWFAILLKLLYVRQNVPLSHHLVFTMHTFSFVFVVMTIWAFIEQAYLFMQWSIETYVSVVVMGYLAYYLLVALRVNFSQDWGVSIVKLCALLFLFSIMFLPAMLLVVVITFMQLLD